MCTVITHPAVPIALFVWLPQDIASSSLLAAGSICSVIPDMDVIGLSFGVRYGDMLGHRGFTHSIFFAGAVAGLTTLTFFQNGGSPTVIFLFLFLSTLSHPLLDALTDGGLGVGFFAPFSNKRYFFPYRPIQVSPMGVASLFSSRFAVVLLSELRWVWVPSAGLYALGYLFRHWRSSV